ncbi:MAG: hypothetical protein ACK4VO_09260 [Pseudobdellovibrio sp.]
MKKILLILILFPMSSWALLTARATYTGLVSKDALSEVCSGTSCAGQTPSMVPLYGLGADVIVKLPIIPIGFGVRYENLGLDATSGSIEGHAKLTRTAALINYRFIDTIIHFGVIGSYGISHSGNVSVKSGNTNVVDYNDGSFSTYTAGLELEVKPLIVLPLIVGAEAGYMSAKWNDAKDSIASTKKDVDLSGSYIKFFLGLDI